MKANLLLLLIELCIITTYAKFGHSFFRFGIECFMVSAICFKHRCPDVCMRPDIALAVNKLTQYLTNPREERWLGAKSILKFLRKTKNYGVI
ncbi:hypothetical protein O6H91_17G090600 [Diphasiastrum complanatum]|uniref:Uncharacterized protein n=1 Tax=Diphasiastrum complanatum TaxID=34168 RepID=A0ACC2B942_DIPCM|nr:hypothetical protein O6H91_17G090600 [Diphasiastrum complanatum]